MAGCGIAARFAPVSVSRFDKLGWKCLERGLGSRTSNPHVTGRRLRELLGLCPSWMSHCNLRSHRLVQFLVRTAIQPSRSFAADSGATRARATHERQTCPQTDKPCTAAVALCRRQLATLFRIQHTGCSCVEREPVSGEAQTHVNQL